MRVVDGERFKNVQEAAFGTGHPLPSCRCVPAPQPNRLLAAIGDGELPRHVLREVSLEPDRVLIERGDLVGCVHFPQSTIIAQQVVDGRGKPLAATIIGSEGLVGLGACLGGCPAVMRQVVLMPGMALSLDRNTLMKSMDDSNSVRELLGSYGDAFACQSLQLAACMARHSIEERMARCLLNCLDSGQTTELHLAEDVLSIVLGVRRSALVMTAKTLQAFGIIEYRDGVYTVVQRAALEDCACDCYAIIGARYQRLGARSGISQYAR